MSKGNRKRHICEYCAGQFACNAKDLSTHRVVYDGMNFTVCSSACAAGIVGTYWPSQQSNPRNLLVAVYPGKRLL